MQKYVVEAIGTFFLVLTIALTGNPLAIGAILIAMIYMGGYISGAQYNPAVTLAVWVRGNIAAREAIRYMGSQIAGAALAAYVSFLITSTPFFPKPTAPPFSTFLLELLFTFALASVVLHVATSHKTKDNPYYAVAIGLTVMAGAFSAGPLSGGVFNPAVTLGALVADITTLPTNIGTSLWYTVAAGLGGIIAGILYRSLFDTEK